MLEEDVGDAIQPDHKRLNKLGRGHLRLPAAHDRLRGLLVPRPSQVCPGTDEAAQRENTVPEEDATLNEMREPIEDFTAPENTAIGHRTSQESSESKWKDDPVNHVVHAVQDTQSTTGDHPRHAVRQESTHKVAVEPAPGFLRRCRHLLFGLLKPVILGRRLAGGRSRAVDRRAGLRALAAVSRPAVLVHWAGRVRALMIIRSDRQESRALEGARLGLRLATARIGEDQGQDGLRANHPRNNPADLVVCIVLV